MFILPRNEYGIVNRARNNIFTYQGWPSVCRDENGVLYAVSSSFRCGHVCPFGKTAMYISRDNGKTWSPPTIINDTYLDDRDAGILYLGSGRMLVTWFELHTGYYQRNLPSILSYCNEGSADVVREMINSYSKIPHEYQNGGSFIRISENYGVTWSEPIRIPVTAPHGPNVCRDGTLIYLGKDMDSYTTDREDALNVITLYISEDGGYTWIKQGVCNKPDGTVWESFHEPHVIELPDGSLFGMIRGEGERVYHGFTMYTTISHDRGRTWSEWIPLNIIILRPLPVISPLKIRFAYAVHREKRIFWPHPAGKEAQCPKLSESPLLMSSKSFKNFKILDSAGRNSNCLS